MTTIATKGEGHNGEIGGGSHFADLKTNPASGPHSIEDLAAQIQELDGLNGTEQMLRLGEAIHRTITSVGGEIGSVASLRKIANHPMVPFKVTTLWRAVAVYQMSLRLPHVMVFGDLGVSHLRAVIGLDPRVQEELLTAAHRERWSKRKLEKAAAEQRGNGQRRGRRPAPRPIALAHEIERALDKFDLEHSAKQASLDPHANGRAIEVLENALSRLQRVIQTLAESA